jgi:septum formation protein
MFVLASKSPRRRALLASVGLHPEIVAADADETPLPNEAPIPYAMRVAEAKARAIDAGDRAVLAADTVVALDGAILAKATDRSDAIRMLRQLSGRWHTVHTAVVLVRGASRLAELVSTPVRFRELSDDEIARYVDTQEPMDKAGAYGIQGEGGALVAEVRGSYTNVVGLPLEETLRMLALMGLA